MRRIVTSPTWRLLAETTTIFLAVVALSGCGLSAGGGGVAATDAPAGEDEATGDGLGAGADNAPGQGAQGGDKAPGDAEDAENTDDAQNADDQAASDPLTIDPDTDHFKGDPSAPNAIIEYGNFLCSHCISFFSDHLPDLQPYIDDGRVLYVYRHLTIGESAAAVAQAAECAAAQDEAIFFPYHDRLYSASGDISIDMPRQLATDLGLDVAAFDDCLTTGATADRVARDVRSGAELGVAGTPTFFVNEQKLEGVQPIESFEALLD